jgi:hypothetical protein
MVASAFIVHNISPRGCGKKYLLVAGAENKARLVKS